MLDQNTSIPLYEQMKQAIQEDIDNQVYRPGVRLPSEGELEQKYQVSRITVRRAVKELCDQGILVRKQGKGTFVVQKPMYAHLDRIGSGFHDSMEAQGSTIRVDILEKRVIRVDSSWAKDLKIDPNDEVLYVKRLMYADNIPSMLDNCYIPLKRFPGIVEKMDENASLYRILTGEYGVNVGRDYKVIRVRKATEEMSRLLECEVGDPMFDLYKLIYNIAKEPQVICISYLKGENTWYCINGEDEKVNQNGVVWRH